MRRGVRGGAVEADGIEVLSTTGYRHPIHRCRLWPGNVLWPAVVNRRACRTRWGTLANLRGLVARVPSQGEDTALRAAMAASVRDAARCKGPLPDGTRVYVDELTFGVVTYATGAE